MKKGFTLIELLAVIIVLAIISLISVPIIMDVLEDFKFRAAENSVYGIISSANNYYAEEYIKNSGSFSGYECTYSNKAGCDKLLLKGDKPTSGSIKINELGIVSGKVQLNNYTFYICNNKVTTEENNDCNIIKYELIFDITQEGIITGFKRQEVSILDKILPIVNASSLTEEANEYIKDGKMTIPEYVGNIEVNGIGANAFSNYEIKEITILSNKALTVGGNAFPSSLVKLKVGSCFVNNYNVNAQIEAIGPACEVEKPVNYKCKRATTLHESFGNLGTGTTLNSGDAFDCDVNGDGIYDSETERFYYVSDYYDTESKTFDSNYAVLVYYKNYGSKITYSEFSYNGPTIAKTVLPTIEDWSNVRLYKTTRSITNAIGGTAMGSITFPTDFSYEGYAARLLTLQEARLACGNRDGIADRNYIMENCPFLLETSGNYWLENPDETRSDYVFIVQDMDGSVTWKRFASLNIRENYVRPVIEIAKTDIEGIKPNNIKVEFEPQEGAINEYGWAKEDFYVKVNITSAFGVKKVNICNTTSEECDPSKGIEVYTSNINRLITTDSASNKICVQVTNNNDSASDVICSDVYKLDKIIPSVTINKSVVDNINVLTANVTSTSISGYSYQWYKNENIIEGATQGSYATDETGTYKVKVITKAGLSSTSDNLNITNLSSILCKRATSLHTDGVNIYGNLGQSGALNSGDAFDCDVNGDGIYDAATERFYYVSDYYDTKNNKFNSDYAVLIYYSNTIDGINNNEGTSEYSVKNTNYMGPTIAVNNLPTTTKWSNVNLISTTRAIINQEGGNSTTGGTLPDAFSYEGYAARLLTAQEINKACGITTGSYKTGELDSCTYLLENTNYLANSGNQLGYWLETPDSKSYKYAFRIIGSSRSIATFSVDGIASASVRPVIEIEKSRLDTGINEKIRAEFKVQEGAINGHGWAKENFYITINVIDDSGIGIEKVNVCTTTSEDCDFTTGSEYDTTNINRLITLNSDSNKVCVQAIDNNGHSSKVICSDLYKLDKETPESGTIKVNGSSEIKTWYKEDIQIELIDGSDTLSGHLNTTVNITSITENTSGKEVVVTTTDKAGNTKTRTYIIKLDKTIPSVTISNDMVDNKYVLTANVSPETTISGYSYQWYKNGNIIAGAIQSSYTTIEAGTYKVKVTTGTGLFGMSAEIKVGNMYLCKRAKTLHNDGVNIYGNLGTGDIFTSGDAFDCDVNGDGIYDAETERFYYVSDYYDTKNNTFNSDYAVLIYYSNTIDGINNNEGTSPYSVKNTNYMGPTIAINNLPTTTKWSNVNLISTTRAIINQEGGTSTTGGALPDAFSYEGYAARMLTAQEINKACGITVGSYKTGELDSCTYLLENTNYLANSGNQLGYWLETPDSKSYKYAFRIIGSSRNISKFAVDGTASASVRPVIEIPKTSIE